MYTICHFKQFLLERRFMIRTDHKALKWMLNWEQPNTTQYCTWIAELEIFDFEIEHRSGIKHLNADFLSRPTEKCEQCEILHKDPKRRRNVKVCNALHSVDVKLEKKIENIHSSLGHIGINKLLHII